MSDPTKISRRSAMQLGLVTAGAALGCERPSPSAQGIYLPDAASGADAGTPDTAGPHAQGLPDAAETPPDEGAADVSPELGPEHRPEHRPDLASERALTPEERLAGIDTFVILCMENRSFDHVLGARRLLEGRAVDGLTAGMNNPDRQGRPVPIHRLTGFASGDPPHDWDPVHQQWNDGAMDGFVRAHPGTDAADVMGYYAREDLPVTWALADAFVTCDRWFCSVLGPTWPNRFYLHGGTSGGVTSNVPLLGFSSVFNRLDSVGKTHRNYFCDVAWATGGYLKLGGNAGIESFFADARAGTLPNLAFVDPQFFGAGANDDHPDHDVRLGQAFIGSIYAALRASPQWDRSLFVVTYDEHGGFFDHVPPPSVDDERPEFQRLGVRVPALVAGGTVRRGAIVSQVFDHVSIIATLTRRFGLRPLNDRVRQTHDLSACIDPALVGRSHPGPALPPPPPVPLARLEALDRSLAGRPPTSHRDLWDAIQALGLPAHLDRRSRSLEIARQWLTAGQRLGAVELR